jgi:hypothetical protein
MQLPQEWRAAYRANRYARHLSQDELDSRLRDLIVNIMVTSHKGLLGPRLGPSGLKWMELFTHMLEELTLRHRPYPAGFTRDFLRPARISELVGPLAQKAAQVLSHYEGSTDDILVKYGKREFMTALLEHGQLRIQPASYFATVDHVGAMKDDELSLPLSFALPDEQAAKLGLPSPEYLNRSGEYRLDVDVQAPADYWLYCLAKTLEVRLFADFEADACVIIRDVDAFSRRLWQSELGAAIEVKTAGLVGYIDPLLPSTPIFVPFAKHFRYAYQEEYRFLWLPSALGQARLNSVDVALGSLEGLAELITL